jgi:hypothetical protein
MDTNYDSAGDTLRHIRRVGELINGIIISLLKRISQHDATKIDDSSEKALFDEYTPKLKGVTYGSVEYQTFLDALKPALEHHYSVHRHHPEHFENGIDDMNLIDLIEMLMDWKAASERHNDGNIRKSLELNAKRFKMNPKLTKILENTVNYLGW